MVTLLIFLQLAVVLAMIFIGARVGGIGFDRTGTTGIGRFVINHSFQIAGFITTFLSIAAGYLLATMVC